MTPGHELLLGEMERYIESLGGISFSASYADHLSGDAKRILSNLHTVPATYIRTRSDRICFSQTIPMLFEFDAKTNASGQDFFVECLPVWHHLLAYHNFHVPTLYGFRWLKSDLGFSDIGILLDDDFRAKVEGVFVYPRLAVSQVTDFVRLHYKEWFPNSTLIVPDQRRGSGDPSIKICRATIKNCPHWKDLLCSMLTRPPTPRPT